MIIDEYVEPALLTGFVRNVPTPYALLLNQVLPDRFIPDIEAAIDQVTRVNRAAQFRSWDTETPIGVRDSFQRSRVKLPPLGIKTPIGEHERLMLERIRTGGDNRDGYVNAIYDDAANNTRAVLNRMEVARGDVLVDGKFTLAGENGLFLEADFGVPGSNIVNAAVVWSDHDDSHPLQEIKTWVDTYIDINGEAPGSILTSNTVMNNLLLADEFRKLFNTVGSPLNASPNLITPVQVNQVLQAHGLPPIQQYNTKIQVDGVNTRVIPEDKLIFLPSDRDSLGFTAWGVTAEALELAGVSNPQLSFQELPGLIGVVLREGDPVRVWTKVGAVGMPIITDPNKLMVADVLA
ncbi:major capsid protein [Plantactinospora sp. S1510]|uniref:Major capsid protein n=1 Tax=Plantactinospora alkalitolerans TaxID=2789879 RepID=A0ABS0HA07_9ACTN|nr:major capsid protein [Plantactinospora alkalitolerans]MBF9135319.1 major capsid protein [Plantactinospora alkalitolerans]